MTISYPISRASFAELLKVSDAPFRLVQFVEMSGTADGRILESEIAEPMWFCDVEINNVTVDYAEWVQSMVEALGPGHEFNMVNTRRPYPLLDPTGSILGSSLPTLSLIHSNGVSVKIDNLPAAYKLSVGDMFSIPYGDQRALYRVVESATADGFGLTPYFEVRPPVRAGTELDVSVILKKPPARMRIVPGSFKTGSRVGNIVSGMGFSAYEVFA